MDEGSYGGGFALGFFLGIAGLLVAITLDKPETRRGAAHGFITAVVTVAVISVCVLCGVISATGNLSRIF